MQFRQTVTPFLLALMSLLTGTAAAQSSDGPNAARGKDLYLAAGCKHCHGTVGQGSAAGKRLVAPALPVAAITQFIRAVGTTMPAYSAALLNDRDVADIAAYLSSIQPSPQADQIPALQNLNSARKGKP